MDASSRAGRRKAPRLSLLGPILCLTLAALAGGCGIDDYPYLYPASGVSPLSSTTLDFTHNTANDSAYFLGYEVYYRIYDGDSSSAIATATSDDSYIRSSWDDISPDVIFARLNSKGYSRIVDVSSGAADAPPLVDVASADTGKTIYAEFALTAAGYGTIAIDGSLAKNLLIRRNSYDSAGKAYRNFGDFKKDSDCLFEKGLDPADYAYVQAYVFAYGLDANFKPLISRPTMLTNGAIALTKE